MNGTCTAGQLVLIGGAEDRTGDCQILRAFVRLAGDTRARRFAERAYLLAPDVPQAADTLAWIMVQQGEAGTALGLLRKASAAAPGDPSIRYHLAVALNQTGNRDEARKLLASLLAERAAFDDKPAAEKLLAELSPH